MSGIINVNGVVTLKGFNSDKHGNVAAVLGGDTGILKMNAVVGDEWRTMDMNAKYIVETTITPVQATIEDVDASQTTIYDVEDEEADDSELLLPA